MNLSALAWDWLTKPPPPPTEGQLLLQEVQDMATETHAAAELFCVVCPTPSIAENLPSKPSFVAEHLTDFLIKE